MNKKKGAKNPRTGIGRKPARPMKEPPMLDAVMMNAGTGQKAPESAVDGSPSSAKH